MPKKKKLLFKRYSEKVSIRDIEKVPGKTRGLYALLNERRRYGKHRGGYDVVYVGISRVRKSKGILERLESHKKSIRKKGKWTHFRIFEANNGTHGRQILELEAVIRFLYKDDKHANYLNEQKKSKKYLPKRVELDEWK